MAAANRRVKNVPRILERKYNKLGTSGAVSVGNKKQLRIIKTSKIFLLKIFLFFKLLPLNYLKQRFLCQIFCDPDALHDDNEGEIECPEKNVEQAEASITDVEIVSEAPVWIFDQHKSKSIDGLKKRYWNVNK